MAHVGKEQSPHLKPGHLTAEPTLVVAESLNFTRLGQSLFWSESLESALP